MKLEICTGDFDSVRAAVAGGADRIELCSALDEGGLTPSWGLLQKSVKWAHGRGVKVNVLIRPRGGDFLYDADEQALMTDDIIAAREAGADGVVVGALTADGDMDEAACKNWVTAAGDLSLTFHRAFDVCRNPLQALRKIAALGFDRLLTSGQAPTAVQGIDLLKTLVEVAPENFCVMPGCGVLPENVATILRATGATEIHASARSTLYSKMNYRQAGVEMGRADRDEYARKVTDAEVVTAIKHEILT